MSELQRKSLLKTLRNFVCFVVACAIIYFTFKSENFAVLFWGMVVLTMIIFIAYTFISDCVFDWKLKGIFIETEYEEYQECYRMFGWMSEGRYIPTDNQIELLVNQHGMDDVAKGALVSMKDKLTNYMNEVKK